MLNFIQGENTSTCFNKIKNWLLSFHTKRYDLVTGRNGRKSIVSSFFPQLDFSNLKGIFAW